MLQSLTTAQINSLPQDYQKSYNTLKEKTEGFKELYFKSEIIKNATDSLYKKIIKKLAEQEKGKNEPKAKRVSARKQSHLLKKHILEKFPTISKVKVSTERFSGGSAYRIEYHAPNVVSKLEDYLSDNLENYQGMDNYDNSIIEHKKGIVHDGALITPKKFLQVTFTEEKISSKKTPTKAKAKKSPQSAKVVPIKKTTPPKKTTESHYAITFIRSFLRMIGKSKEVKSLENLLKKINKAADAEEIRAASTHATAIKYVANSLVDAINSDYKKITFSLNKEGSDILEPYMTAKMALPNRLLRQFYNAQNKKFSVSHDKLLSRLKKLDTKNEPYSDEIEKAIKTLEAAKRNSSTIKATQAQLRGLSGLGKARPRSRTKKRKNLDGFEVKDILVNATVGAVAGAGGTIARQALSGFDIVKNDYPKIILPEKYNGTGLQNMGRSTKGFIYGLPKMGKSTLLIDFANDLAEHGKVLYASPEEMIDNKTLADTLNDRIMRVGRHHNVHYTKDFEGLNLDDYDFIIIDSINKMRWKLDDFVRFIEENKNKGLWFVSQVTKGGVFRGSQELTHEVDVIVNVTDKGIAEVDGRFGTGTYNFYNENWNVSEADTTQQNYQPALSM
ncbi:hypothetical protein [Bernardetia sp.]|uniref:hypothetical protein n=1 Tax=Bernardetia sp. TaxID=1937974 RepID=UPI0025BE0091|nr:hypothetical protein [Bernardetia sp.]